MAELPDYIQEIRDAGGDWTGAWWEYARSQRIPVEDRAPAPPEGYIPPENFDPGEPVGLGGPTGTGFDPAAPSFGGPGIGDDRPKIGVDFFPLPQAPGEPILLESRDFFATRQWERPTVYQDTTPGPAGDELVAGGAGAGGALAVLALLVLGFKSR